MPNFRSGRVDSIATTRKGLQYVTVDGEPAYVLTDVIGTVQVGDAVILNTTAVDLGLGTGGRHVVHWNLSRSHVDIVSGGHMMKARYLSEQTDVVTWEETAVGAEDDAGASALDGLTVVGCLLHSHVGALAAAIAHNNPAATVAFVMTDWASIPIALSNLMHQLCEANAVDFTVTTGHAFGGDVEAVSTASGLLAAKKRGADIALVGPGPGHAGTATALGFSAIESVGVLDMASALGATTACLARWSSVDQRPRHRGLSHHTRTILSLLARPIEVPVPVGHVAEMAEAILIDAGSNISVTPVGDIVDVAAALESLGMAVSSMGRDLRRDRDAVAVVGAVARWCDVLG